MSWLSSIKIVRAFLALAVTLWMAGAGCMLGCENMVSASATSASPATENTSIIVATGSACAAKHGRDCCKKHQTQPAAKATANNATAKSYVRGRAPVVAGLSAIPAQMMDCPMAVNATAALSKAGIDQASVALASSSEPAALFALPEYKSAFSHPLKLPNRGHTYLRCCVFLI